MDGQLIFYRGKTIQQRTGNCSILRPPFILRNSEGSISLVEEQVSKTTGDIMIRFGTLSSLQLDYCRFACSKSKVKPNLSEPNFSVC
jgi:hypothetical protein